MIRYKIIKVFIQNVITVFNGVHQVSALVDHPPQRQSFVITFKCSESLSINDLAISIDDSNCASWNTREAMDKQPEGIVRIKYCKR